MEFNNFRKKYSSVIKIRILTYIIALVEGCYCFLYQTIVYLQSVFSLNKDNGRS